MPEYLYRIQPARSGMLSAVPTSAEDTAVKAHYCYLQAVLQRGVVRLAGCATHPTYLDTGPAICYV